MAASLGSELMLKTRTRKTRAGLLRQAIVLSVWISLFAPIAALGMDLDQEVVFDIPAQDLSTALIEFSRQARLQVIVSDDLSGRVTQGVSGRKAIKHALGQLLEPAGLSYRVASETSITVGKASGTEAHTTLRSEPSLPANVGDREEALEEVVVTAQKRLERLQEVPVPVTSISAGTLVNSNQLRIQDYYSKIPGLNLTLLGDIGQSSLSIRGLTTGGNVLPTVGIVVDDIPFGPSIYVANGSFAPDFDPSELSRVEVLRGPQGTLYGANSLGGLMKFVTIDPSVERISGGVQLGMSSVRKSDELGYSVRGSVNVPLTETFAVRASASRRREPGYIDNLQTAQEDVNDIDSESARLAALWRPSEKYSVKLSALYQSTEQAGTADTHLPSPLGPRADLGDLQQSTLPGSGIFTQEMRALSATLTANLASAQLTSLSGYNIKQTYNALDTPLAFLSAATQARFGVRGFVTQADTEVSKLTQELRLTVPVASRIEWLLGLFYTHEDAEGHSDWQAIDQTTGAVAGNWLVVDSASTYEEYAAFTDFTFQLSERFDLQVGGRFSRNDILSGAATTIGPYNTVINGLPSDISITPAFQSDDTPVSYLLTPRFRISPDLMVYGRMASGYRPGGPNTSAAAVSAGAAASYEADTTRAYEIGAKGNVLGRGMSFDASLYYIDWEDVQLQARDPNNPSLLYTINAGAAKSKGVELSVDIRPLEGMSISAWVAYNDARLSSVPVNLVLNARRGDRLPYSAPKSGSLSIEQEFPLWGSAIGHVGASMSYVGDRKGRFFTNNVVQGDFPAYTQVDLRAGAQLGTWDVALFVNNVTDERGILRGGRDASLGLQYIVTYIQPRAAGLSLSKSF
jgi:iron complex outermembrane receptor protein